MDRQIDHILEWIKTSSFVCDSNSELDMYLLKNEAKGRLQSGRIVNLVDWLKGFSRDKDNLYYFEPKKLGDYYLTDGYTLHGKFSGYSFLEKIRRVNRKECFEKDYIDSLKTALAQFEQVSTDSGHAISPMDGILAFEDKRSGLVWDTGCIFASEPSARPEDMSPLLNEVSYAGYDDWRVATKFDLSTIFSYVDGALHVIHPLSLVTPSSCWASFGKFIHKNKDRYCFNTRTGNWERDDYYSDKRSPSGAFMYVRGEAQVSAHEWMNKLAHWLSCNEPYTDISLSGDSQNLESTLPQMKSLAVFCHSWHEPPILPNELTYLKELEKLIFDYCRRSEDSAGIDFDLILNFRSLKSLTLEGNRITSIPSNIRNLALLQKFDLKNNLIESLPTEISELRFLSEINLSRNKFTDLPKEIFSLQGLKAVNLESNLIRSISQFNSLPELKSLNLKSNKILEIPQSIINLNSLVSLDISYNQLERLPTGIGQLHALETLNLNANPLLCLPEEIGSLTNLEELDISSTKVKRLPQAIVNLKKLKVIKLNLSNRVEEWPNVSLSRDQLDWVRELIDSNNCRVNSDLQDLLERE